jgi:hypothetical protein
MHTALALAPKTDPQRLREMGRQFVLDYPDLHDLACAAAQKIIRQHTRKQIDPQRVYWHRFASASSSPRTFTGWQHNGKPVESMTLVDLVMHRFNTHDQQATDELSLYGGFYVDGPEHEVFDETNEVPMLPQEVLRDFWALDFSAAYNRTLERFWATHGENFRVLAKVRFLAAAGECLRRGQLSLDHFGRASAVVAQGAGRVPPLDALRGTAPTSPDVSVHTLDLGGIRAHDILRIVGIDGQQVLYMPDAAQPFRGFDNEKALYDWVQKQLMTSKTRAEWEGHFLRSSAERAQHGQALMLTVGRLLTAAWCIDQTLLNQHREAIAGDAFTYLRDLARQQMTSDATQLLTSNNGLRKQMWIGYLSAFMQVFGGLAPLGWPIALTLVGASLVSTGLNVDQAINGKSVAQRKAGVLGAVLSTVYLFCNLPLLASMRPVAKVTTVIESGVEPSWAELENSVSALDELVHNAPALDTLTPTAQGRFRGIYVLENGQTWIKLDKLPQRVVFNEELRCWVIIDPHNPFAFHGLKPVRRNALEQWEILTSPGLSGGAPMDLAMGPSGVVPRSFASVRSTFWDRFTQLNIFDEQLYSDAALKRQEEVVSILELDDTDAVGYDSEGNDAYEDEWGAQHRVFKDSKGEYVGASIRLYTQEDASYNAFLRTGIRSPEWGPRDLRRLVEDLGIVGFNNDVELYRGGSGGRNTSGLVFRSGRIRLGDVLVNTDISSFTENPYMARTFASSQNGESIAATSSPVTFDDTSVIFVLPAKSYLSATPVAPFSASPEEAESLFLPGHYFQIDSIEEVSGEAYRFMKVAMREVSGPLQGRGLYDLRTGELFSRSQYAAMLGIDAQDLVNAFFPLPM